MKNVFLAVNMGRFSILGCFMVFLSLATLLASSLLADQRGAGKPTKEEVIQKTQTLQMPFIANNGQTDERVRFYANTFGGTVFVTKDGEIVYSLPSGRDVPAGASQESRRGLKHGCSGAAGQGGKGEKQESGWHGQALLVHAKPELVVANAYSPLSRADNAKSPPDRGFTKSLLAAYLPGLQKSTDNPQSPIRGVALKEQLIGGKINEIKGGAQSVTTVSYFKGNDPSKWKSNILTYNIVDMGEVYEGIGLRLKAYGNNVEKLFTVTPGANPEQIKIRLDGIQHPESSFIKDRRPGGDVSTKSPLEKGARGLSVNEHGELVAETELGPVKFTKPVAYQEIGGKRVEVDVEYRIQESAVGGTECRGAGEQGCRGELETQNSKLETSNSKLTYGFTVASYDKTKDLIIDPLLASTYLGGSGDDEGYSFTLDTSGNVYVTGVTNSTNFPTTSGAYDTSLNGDWDVFVSKLNSGLTSLLASMFLGGSSDDGGNSLALDTSGNVYVTGVTDSTDFPTTSGAYDTSYNGKRDVFFSKLNSGLTSLLASTFLGGSEDDYAYSLAIGTSGNIYVTGITWSTTLPTTSGAYDSSLNGNADVFVSKLNSGLTSLLASTFLGGSDGDYAYSLALDTSGNVYVTGYTTSANFPTTGWEYGTTLDGNSDVFVSKLNGGLTSLLASTFLGGSGDDEGYFLTLDTSGNVYVTGYTSSTDFPTTSGAYDTSYNDTDYSDIFVSRLNSGLTSLLASTFLGGSDDEEGYAITIDTSGNVYVMGSTWSANFPTTNGAYDSSFNGNSDLFVSKLNGGLASLLASTFMGGSDNDEGYALTLDTSGDVYVMGSTWSTNFPTTNGAYDTSYNGGYNDLFVSKMDSNLSDTVTQTGAGYLVTDTLWIRAVINTVEKGPVDAVWQKGGESTTARGDRAIWGHFYASPSDVSWGSQNNPDLYVKIWFDVSGRIDVNYFHVSVPDIAVYSEYPYNGSVDLQGTTTMSRRYIRHYFQDGVAFPEENYEDGIAATGYNPKGSPAGFMTINNLMIGTLINTVEKGLVGGEWRWGGQDTTARGDQVVWGFFYASPSDVSWGNKDNPDLYVKIWFDVSGRIDVNYFHVSVPDIEVYSDYPADGFYNQKGTTIMADRYIRHEFFK